MLPDFTKFAAYFPIVLTSSLVTRVDGKAFAEKATFVEFESLCAVLDVEGTAPPNCLMSEPSAASSERSFRIVTSEALNGVYTMIAVEEKDIRNDISARTTTLLKRVFSLQD